MSRPPERPADDEGHEENEPTWGLVVPFTCCVSQGGAFDDLSFAAGYELGWLDQMMTWKTASIQAVTRGSTYKQLDLLAMHRGWVLTLLGGPEIRPEDEEWVQIELTRAKEGFGGG